uniref:TIDP3065 n=1 Tax=Arundo donax TaxID=35708 RepID=A0A0A9EGY8_ARUDO
MANLARVVQRAMATCCRIKLLVAIQTGLWLVLNLPICTSTLMVTTDFMTSFSSVKTTNNSCKVCHG